MTVNANVRIIRAGGRGAASAGPRRGRAGGDVELNTWPLRKKSEGPCTPSRTRLATSWSAPLRRGAAVSSDCLRQPLAVHRGEVVTVYAQSGAVRIRTNARSRDEGSVGELVAVESLLNRSTYYARVSGVREVEVYARPPRVEGQVE